MSEYVDTKLINCNRLASVEARTGNNSNPAVFTNPLNETVKLDVGDKVSLERAFINEVGAGNPQTIEFKGVSTGTNIVSTYTDIAPGNYYYARSSTFDPNYRLGYYRTITTNEVVGETTELKDNLAPMIFGYYITSNEYPNYIQQPRRFAQTSDTREDQYQLIINTTQTAMKQQKEQHTILLMYYVYVLLIGLSRLVKVQQLYSNKK